MNHASAHTPEPIMIVVSVLDLMTAPASPVNRRPYSTIATSTTPKAASSPKPRRRRPARRWAAPGTSADSAVQPISEAVVSGRA
ncbi:hypothetical protein Mth01_07070 [Sphaerimonospora thailandensis]|uniref:Uncharacterized protein n=1 Tax=Sphaerimonospora thailandensis TaxID=795644 RepID=A0A8J3R6N8_9ACTN|nr:hypothetical protein Mth01_07070 [Sphaerimonospora thailandensis]